MILLQNLTKTYRSKTAKVTTDAINNISLEIRGHGLVFVVGKSGSGKSTLLNLLGGLDRQDKGEIRINGVSTINFSDNDLDSYRNNNVGFIFQEYNLIDDLNIEENIGLSYKLRGKKPNKEEINKLLAQLDLEGYNKRLVEELSGGQKQRVAIARALAKNPALVLADEPTGSLDSNTGEKILKILKDISKDRLVVVVSHDHENAEKYADRIIELHDGKIKSDIDKTTKPNGSSEPFTKQSGTLQIREIFKLGMLGLKHHRARLLTSIILMSLSLMLFGIASTFLTYDESQVSLKGMELNQDYFISIEQKDYVRFTDQTISEMKNATGSVFQPMFYDELMQYSFYGSAGMSEQYLFEDSNYDFARLMEISKANSDKLHFDLVAGEYPTALKQIMVTKVFYDLAEKTGFKENNIIKNINRYEDLLNSKIGIFEITGILDTHIDEEKYYPILFSKREDLEFNGFQFNSRIVRELEALFQGGPHNVFYVSPGYYESTMKNDPMKNTTLLSADVNFYQEARYLSGIEAISKMGFFPVRSSNLDPIDSTAISSKIYWKNDVPLESLSGHQILLSWDQFVSVIGYSAVNEDKVHTQAEELLMDFAEEFFADVSDIFLNPAQYADYIKYDTLYFENLYHPGKTYHYFYDKSIVTFLNEYAFSDYLSSLEIEIGKNRIGPLQIVGVYNNGYDSSVIPYDTVFLSDELYNDMLTNYRLQGYPLIAAIRSGDYKTDLRLFDYLYHNYLPIWNFTNDIIYSVSEGQVVLQVIAGIFGATALIMSVFALLLFYNYMVVSIQIKHKSIGIMRALGATKKNVFMIFYSETLILAVLNAIIAIIGSAVVTILLNWFVIRGFLGFSFSILSHGFMPIFAIVSLSLLLSTVTVLVPIWSFSKKQPVDIIKGISQ